MKREWHVVCGAPASGKTRFGRILAERVGAVFLDSDEVGERLIRAGMALAGMDPDDRDSPAYKAAFREAVYETLFDLAAAHLGRLPVVLAGPFTAECARADWPDWLERRVGVMPRLHWVSCPPEARRRRIEARGEARDRPKLEDWDAYLRTCREDPPVWAHERVDGEAGP